ncbi:MAG: DUF3566 domain-containing protein [Aggregatilineales bacterium]
MTLRRIGVGAAFKVGLVVNGLITAIFGLIFLSLQVLFFGSLFASMQSFSVRTFSTAPSTSAAISGMNDWASMFSLIGLGMLCFIYLIMVLVSALFGGLGYALLAALYNLAARWVGGLEFELTPISGDLLDQIEWDLREKYKRSSY